nr:cytochrome P450 CYP72A219-like [Ipomoea batatas]
MNMVSSFSIAMFCLVVFWAYWAWKTLSWLWFKPKKLERRLRQQGFNGNSYRPPFGDLKETAMLMAEANSKPISFTNEIFPRVLPSLHKTIKNYGKNAFMWKGPQPEVLIMDPELIREVFTKYTVFQRPPRILLCGLATYEKDKWVKHRRLLNPAFHAEKLKHMVPAFYLSCSEMLSKWEKLVGAEGSELDVWPHLRTLTADGISRTAFGSNYEEGRKIFELQQEQTELAIQIARSLYNIPGLRYLPTKRNRRMKQIFNQVRSSILGMIDKRMKAIEAGESRNDDLLGIMLESNLTEIQQHGSKSYGRHLEWQERARQEILQVIGTTEEPDSNKLNQLKIVTMILNEVLRLYPPGVPFGRVIEQDTKLRNITLPAGIQILIPPILLQRDEEMWGEDAKEFNPERFREGISKATKGQFSFFPFGWGPRICIGQNFAMLEAKMALAIILRRYAFELSPSYAHAPQAGTALVPQYGAQLILRKLEHN